MTISPMNRERETDLPEDAEVDAEVDEEEGEDVDVYTKPTDTRRAWFAPLRRR